MGVQVHGYDVASDGMDARIQLRATSGGTVWQVMCGRYALEVGDGSRTGPPPGATPTTGIFPADGPEAVELGIVFDYARLMCRLIREHDQRVDAAREATERAFTELRESTGARESL